MRISAAFAAALAGVLFAMAGCSGDDSGQPGFPIGTDADTPDTPSGTGPGDATTTDAKRALDPDSVVPCEVLGKTSLTQFGLSGEPQETTIANHRGPACSVIGETAFVDFQITENEDVDSFREIYGKEGTLTEKSFAGYDGWLYWTDTWKHCDVLINAGPYNMGYVKYERNSGETEPDDAKLCDDVELIATALLETIG